MRILSVGNDKTLLKARHRFLLTQGFEADYALPDEAFGKLESRHFDLIILSATLLHEEAEGIRTAVANRIKVLDLTTIVWPDELLEMIKNAG